MTEQPERKPSMEELALTFFAPEDGSFMISVPEADHALQHYDEMLAMTYSDEHPKAARAGLMAACLAHALGWTAEEGLDKLMHSEPFRELVTLMQDTYKDCKKAGLFPSDKAALS